MRIETNVGKYSLAESATLREFLEKARTNKARTIFTTNSQGKLSGVISSGDLGDWLLKDHDMNLEASVSTFSNKKYIVANEHMDLSSIKGMFRPRIDTIPVINNKGELVSIAFDKPILFQIGNDTVSDESPCYVIAEIGNNHNGSISLAKKLVKAAKSAGANCAKFQMRQLDLLYQDQGGMAGESEDLGAQYVLDLLAKFSLSNEALFEVFDYCKEIGITPLCTPWDEQSLQLLEIYGMEAYKVASADLTNHHLLSLLIETKKPLIISTGMSTEEEVVKTIHFLNKRNATYALLHCNSTYPTPFKDVNLPYLKKLKSLSHTIVGYSGHERGISIALAAVSLGAKVVEKHFTLDKTMEGSDHKVSLIPEEFANMVKGIREIESAFVSPSERSLSQGELMNREVLAKSIIARKDLAEGSVITAKDITIKSPGKGLQPMYLDDLLGRPLKRNIRKNDFFYKSDIELESVCAREYRFNRDWGLPVRFHDFKLLSKMSNPDLVEFHFSYKDLDLKPSKYIDASNQLKFIVHSPELFRGDHILDLCSPDSAYRRQSILEMQRVIDLTRELRPYFCNTESVLIVTNVGGFSENEWLTKTERLERYEILRESIEQLERKEVEIIPQTMPPFPWHFGGQRYHNLFVDPDEITNFCSENNLRVCLDISHSKLACNYFKLSFDEFVRKVGPYTAHLHMVDALGTDGEGLQIGEGEIDFDSLGNLLSVYASGASFIPEVWQGHKNNGEGFWHALESLEGKL